MMIAMTRLGGRAHALATAIIRVGSCVCTMNGMTVCCCNLTMAMCKCDMTKDGVCVTCTSGDAKCCEMIQACCDCLSCMMEAGCTCCVLINNTPICCGTTESQKHSTPKAKAGK